MSMSDILAIAEKSLKADSRTATPGMSVMTRSCNGLHGSSLVVLRLQKMAAARMLTCWFSAAKPVGNQPL